MSGHRIEPVLAGWGFVEKRSNKKGTSKKGLHDKKYCIFQPIVTILLYAMLRYFILLLSLHAKQNIRNLEFLEEISD